MLSETSESNESELDDIPSLVSYEDNISCTSGVEYDSEYVDGEGYNYHDHDYAHEENSEYFQNGSELHCAAKAHDCNRIEEILMTENVDVNFVHDTCTCDCGFKKTSDFETALMMVIDEGCLECTQLLLEKGAEIDWQSACNGYCAFLVACYRGFYDIAQLLINSGCSISRTLTNGRNALHLIIISRASDNSHKASQEALDLVRCILEHP